MTKDLTKGNPLKLILFFTLPLLFGNIFQQLYSMADTIIVGKTISVNALAAVGATGSLSFLIIGFAQGLTSGFSVITAQEFGAENYSGVRRSVAVGTVLSFIITIILTILSVCFIRNLLEIMNTDLEIIEDSYKYIVIICYGIIASVLFNFTSNIIRALGDSKTPLIFLCIACILNIILDFVFIINLKMGVAGAAWATVISQMFSGILCVLYMLKKFHILRFQKEDWKITSKDVKRHLKIGLPMAFQLSIIAIGAMILQSSLNKLGPLAVAAFTAAQKIDTLATQPLMSFGITMATYTAQNYGAGNIERIRQGVKKCILMSLTISIVGGGLIILFGRWIIELLVGYEPQVISMGQIYLIINCSMYFLLALLFIYRNTLQGLGQSLIPTIAGIMELLMRSFAAIYLAQPLKFTGISMASPIAWLGALIPLGIAYYVTINKFMKEEAKRL